MRVEKKDGEGAARKPIRGTFSRCCARARKTEVSINIAKRATKIFFVMTYDRQSKIKNRKLVVFVAFKGFSCLFIRNPNPKSKIQNLFDDPVHPIQHRLRNG